MVAMGLMGGVSLIGAQLIKDNATNESNIRFKAEVAKATAIVQSHLADQNSCKGMLVGKSVGNSYPNLTIVTRTGATIAILKDNSDNTVYDAFTIPTGGIRLEVSNLNNSKSTVTDVVISFQIRSRSFFGRKKGNIETIVKRIPVKTEMNGTVIKSCGPVLADSNLDAKKQLCDGLGTAATWTGTECRLNEVSCPYGQVPYQLTSLGSMICVPVDTKLDASQLFDFSVDPCGGTGKIRLGTGADGKIKAYCD